MFIITHRILVNENFYNFFKTIYDFELNYKVLLERILIEV